MLGHRVPPPPPEPNPSTPTLNSDDEFGMHNGENNEEARKEAEED
jgi:hypothetical protein